MKTLVAFHNDANLKERYVARAKAHPGARLFKITGKPLAWGAVGRTIEDTRYIQYEAALGIPRLLGELEDKLFEGLDDREAEKFPLRFLEAITVGADLGPVMPKFLVWLLVDPTDGVIKFSKSDASKRAIRGVADLWAKEIDGKTVPEATWEASIQASVTPYVDVAETAAAQPLYYKKMADKLIELLKAAQ